MPTLITHKKHYFELFGMVAFNSIENNLPIEGDPTNSLCSVSNKLFTLPPTLNMLVNLYPVLISTVVKPPTCPQLKFFK